MPSEVMNDSINSSNFTAIPKGEIAGIAIRALCFLLGMCGNITVMVVLVRNFKKENFTVQLMLNLAISDILCLATLPVWMCNLLLGWTMDLHLCRFFCFFTHTSIQASVFIVTLMSVQGYVVVLYRPQWSKLGRRGEYGMLVLVWVLAAALAFSPAATYNIVQDGTRPICEQAFWSEEQKVGVLLLETLAIFILPFSTLLVSYLCLHKKVSAKAMGSHQKLATLVTSIVVTFFIFWIPYHIINVMIMIAPSEPVGYRMLRRVAYRGPRRAVQGVVFLNSCVNPLLYAFNYQSLRAEKSGTETNTTQTSNDFS